MNNWSQSHAGMSRSRKKIGPIEFLKQVVTPEDSTGATMPLRLGWFASFTKVTMCVAVAFVCYASIAQLQ